MVAAEQNPNVCLFCISADKLLEWQVTALLVPVQAGKSSRENELTLLLGERWGAAQVPRAGALAAFWDGVAGFPWQCGGFASSSFPEGFLGIAPNPTAHSKSIFSSVRSRQRWCSSPHLHPRQGWDLCEKVFHVRLRAWGDLPASMLGESAAQLLLLVKSQEKEDHCHSPAPWASSSF